MSNMLDLKTSFEFRSLNIDFCKRLGFKVFFAHRRINEGRNLFTIPITFMKSEY